MQFSPYIQTNTAIEKIEKHLQQKSDRFFKKVILTPPEERQLIFAKDKTVSEKFAAEIENNHPDLVIISDKGGNNISSLLIGSLTEELFDEILKSPLLIIK